MKRLLSTSLALILGTFLMLPTQSHARTQEASIRLFLVGVKVSKADLRRALWNKPIPEKYIKWRSYLELRRLRNAIFAIKGARFRSIDLRDFYKKQSWYRPFRSASKVRMNSISKSNMRLILSFEKAAKAKQLKEMKTKTWGGVTAVDLIGASACYDFGAYRVVVEPDGITAAYKGQGGPCDLSIQKKIYKYDGKDMRFRGIVKDVIFLSRDMGSDYQDLKGVSLLNKKVAFKQRSLPPNANLTYTGGKLLFFSSPKMPKSCSTKDYTKLEQTLKACWPDVQKKFPIFKNTPFPGCNCRGLGPYISAQYSWDPKQPNTTTLTGKVTCGCSS
ncbi:MAG: hypothetical protein CL932_14075 [Deltaproteobacteria bacterium]|nr:hypothetical protein [Deltaproteobacteria bacterium]|tara:strand:+ start:1015 stop:2007 length:993 start_codon:yes stop_codon:yes gene_type:complete